jgi:hypothetical protein
VPANTLYINFADERINWKISLASFIYTEVILKVLGFYSSIRYFLNSRYCILFYTACGKNYKIKLQDTIFIMVRRSMWKNAHFCSMLTAGRKFSKIMYLKINRKKKRFGSPDTKTIYLLSFCCQTFSTCAAVVRREKKVWHFSNTGKWKGLAVRIQKQFIYRALSKIIVLIGMLPATGNLYPVN